MRLYLCEKPSQAKDIAAVLGVNLRKPGMITGEGIIVTWAIGHLLGSAPPEVYGPQFCAPWREDVLPLLPQTWQRVVKPDTAAQFAVVKKCLKQATEVVIATDADREGEVIARELLDYCAYTGPVKRLWLSALDESSIRQALASLWPGEKTALLYQAGLARAQADWLTGINLTRLYTLKAQWASGVLSIGRVQTPTLALVVKRDREIEQFIPKPYWQVVAHLIKDNIALWAQWVPAPQYCDEDKRCVQKNRAEAVVSQCNQFQQACVVEVHTKREHLSAPLCFDLGTLQQVCSKKWGMGASQVLDLVQSLYETHKTVTYPRTDCGYLPVVMQKDVPVIFQALQQVDPAWQFVIPRLDVNFRSRVWNDKKITAHHGIIPTRKVFDMTRLSEDEEKVYRLICQYYLAQFLPLQVLESTVAEFDIGGQRFRATGQVTIEAGWKPLFTSEPQNNDNHHDEKKHQEDPENASLPPLSPQDNLRCQETVLKPCHTTPPSPFTEGSLIAAMKNAAQHVCDIKLKQILKDNAGLGTEATRASILDILFKRGFLKHKGKSIHASQTARELIDALPESLTSPGMTALWEQALDEIEQGKLTLSAFMSKQYHWIQHLVVQGRAQTLQLSATTTQRRRNSKKTRKTNRDQAR